MSPSDFLSRYAAHPFTWGVDDCCLFLADWWQAQTGAADPAAHLRGRYSTKEECHALLSRLGGLICVVSDVASKAGARRTRRVEDGVIALLITPIGLVGAIRTGRYWAVRNEQVGFLSYGRPVRMWRV